MSARDVIHYTRRAEDFFAGLRALSAVENTVQARALLAIHSAISYSDALRAGLGDGNLSSDDHNKAVSESTRRLAALRKAVDLDGLKHLQALLGRKSAVAYGKQRIDSRELHVLVTNAERFATWATATGVQLNLEGWTNE